MWSSSKYPFSPSRRDWNFLVVGWGGVSVRTKNLKKCMKLNNLEFPEGWGGL